MKNGLLFLLLIFILSACARGSAFVDDGRGSLGTDDIIDGTDGTDGTDLGTDLGTDVGTDDDTGLDSSQDTSLLDSEEDSEEPADSDTGVGDTTAVALEQNVSQTLDFGVTYSIDISGCPQTTANIAGTDPADEINLNGTVTVIAYNVSVSLSANPTILNVTKAASGTITISCY